MVKIDARRPDGHRMDGRTALAGMALAALAVPAVAWATPATGLFYERTVMREADGRCHLFAPEISAALSASSLQARGAALRAGVSEGSILAATERARTAAFSVPCGSNDLNTAADRVKKAFAGYAQMSFMSFPGEVSTWEARRKPTAPVVNRKAVDGPRWRLSEPGQWDGSGVGALTFGIATENTPVVAVASPQAAGASSAFLIVRDPSKAAEPWFDPHRRDLAGRAPPRAVTRAFVASSRQAAPASLLPGGQGAGALFGFPASAADALAGLDPREAVTVEFTYPGRPAQRAVFEVGDFAAGRAFLMAGR